MAEKLIIRCKNCGRVLRIGEACFGKRIKCPKCETKLFVPGPSGIMDRAFHMKEDKAPATDLSSPKAAQYASLPYCRIMYTEADPVQFALRRKNVASLFDLSEKGLGFLIKVSPEVTPPAAGEILIVDIDFPVLVEPVFTQIQVSSITRTDTPDIYRIAAVFYEPDLSIIELVDTLIDYLVSRQEVWEAEE